jgi:threonyl-tRNA synthetase
MTQDDAHIYCTPGQMANEIGSVLQFVLSLLSDYGIDDFYLELSTRDESDKFIGEMADWEVATAALAKVAKESGLELVDDPGGAAFYGPKISVQARDAIGRTWQVSTLQVDFQLPKRFDLEYADEEGGRTRPVMLHRALFGSVERFIGILVEHYAGAFPFWLSPVQVAGIPIADEHVSHLASFRDALAARGMRMEVDASSDRMQKKIRNAQQQKVPIMAIAGERDVTEGTISFRFRDGTQRNDVAIDEAIEYLAGLNEARVNDSPTA